MREIERQAHAAWKPPKTHPPTYVTAAYDFYRITLPPNRMPRSSEDGQDEQRVKQDVPRREPPGERYEDRFDRGGGSRARRQTDQRYESHTEPESGGRPFDPNSRQLPPRPEAPQLARHELAHQTREALVTHGVDYGFPLAPFAQRTAVGENNEGPSARMNENGKRDRTASSGDSTRAQPDESRSRGWSGRGRGTRGIHSQARGDYRVGHNEHRGEYKRGRR